MKFLPFVLRHLWRNPIRSASTVTAIALCVLLLCTLQSVIGRLDRVVETRSPRRLITRNAVSPMYVLPPTYGPQIRRVPGVRQVALATMFGGLLPVRRQARADESGSADWVNGFQNIAVEAELYFAINPELQVAPDEFRAFLGDLRGCVIGRQLAAKFGWKLGDRFHLESFASLLRRPAGPFEFVIRGFIDPAPEHPDAETNIMVFHFKYLDAGLDGQAPAGLYVVELVDPARGGEVASAIDALFENAERQTLTETERAATAELMTLFGDLGAVVNGIGLAVCFTILLVSANTMSMAVRERRTEIAVLKTLGFTSVQVMLLVVAEAVSLGALGGALGVGGALALLALVNGTSGASWFGVSGFSLQPSVALAGFGLALAIGFAAGLAPASGAYRARVTEMLRSV